MLDTFQLNSVIKQNEYFWIWRSTRLMPSGLSRKACCWCTNIIWITIPRA